MENMQEIRAIQSLEEMTTIIKNELDNIAEGFIAVGYYLKKARDDELYKQQGYTSIFEYAQVTFGISRSVATRFMEVNDTYSIGGYSPQIEERYRGYGSSKLTEMLQLPEDIRENVPVEATVRDIREAKTIVKETESKYDDQMELGDLAQPQEETPDWMKELVVKLFREECKGKFKEFVIWMKSDTGKSENEIRDDILSMINPTKFRAVRLDKANVMMYENEIWVGPYRNWGGNCKFTYIEFAKAFEAVFYPNYPDTGKTAEEAYEAVYHEPLVPKAASKPEEKPINAKKEPKKEPKKPVEKPAATKQKKPEEKPEISKCEEESKPEEQIPGQMELTKDFPEYCPEEILNKPKESEGKVKEEVIEGQIIEDILKSGNADKIIKLLKQEFKEPETGWEDWKTKVVQIDD